MKTAVSRTITYLAICAALVAAPVQGQTINPSEGASPYANVRGWSVYSMGDGRGLFSCRAVRGQGYNDQIMIEYDGFDQMWRVLVRGIRPSDDGPGTKGTGVYYDGSFMDRQIYFGFGDGASNSHAKLDLTDWELGRIKAGNKIRIEINGERSRTWSLSGTTAAILKVSECAQSFGFAPAGMAVAPAPKPSHTPQTQQAAVDGNTVGYVVYPTGQFRHTGGGNWIEEGNNGSVFYFTEYDRNSKRVLLNDASRNIQIRIGLPNFKISYTQNFDNNAWARLYSIECFDRKASRAC